MASTTRPPDAIPDLADHELLSAARRGDAAAFTRLVRRHERLVHGYLRARLATAADLDDLCQEVFVRLYTGRAVPAERANAGLRPWILGIARNVLREHARAAKRRENAWTVNAGRKVQRGAGYPGRSKNAAHNCAAVAVRRIAAKPRYPPTESEARGVYADMEKWTEVRRRVLTGELSKRAACQEYGINWRTLVKMLAHAEPPGYRRKAKREQPVVGPHLAWIHEVLEHDKQEPVKQRHTAKRIFDRLKVERGYTGGYTMVKEAVRTWRDATKEVFVPLSHPPGEAQVDFGFAYVDVAGERQQVALFVMSLPYSDAVYIQAFPRECTEAFVEGHNRAFRFIGGVPKKIRYDNSKIAVAKITGSRERQVTNEFQRLQSHYLFETQFCLVRRANEKGHVEGLVDFGRANFLVPVPKVASLVELNETLEERCREDLGRRSWGKNGTKTLRLEEERSAFLPLPVQECEARRITQAHANSLSLVQFDTNRYSVPVKYAHRTITVVATVDDVKLVYEDRLIARHRRHWGRERYFYDPIHYLALLERKPGAFDYARPLADWQLPECFNVLRRRMERTPDGLGTKEFIRVLLLLEKASLEELSAAVEYAMGLGIADADTIRVIVEHRRESPVALFCLDSRPHLKLVHVPPTNITAYASLLGQEGST